LFLTRGGFGHIVTIGKVSVRFDTKFCFYFPPKNQTCVRFPKVLASNLCRLCMSMVGSVFVCY
jgi:hypothetical protein